MQRFLFAMLFAATVPLHGQSLPLDPGLGIATIPLYADGARGGIGADRPTLTVFVPRPGQTNGSAVVVAPGGAYLGLASDLEGRQVADWFASRGFTAFVLKYRVGPRNEYPIPLLDAQRAVRLTRSLAQTYGFLPNRVGMIGFSAGGHLTAATETLYDLPKPVGTDPVDQLSARPDFAVLAYAWLNAMEPQAGAEITYCSVMPSIPREDCGRFASAYTPKLHVTRATPPTFMYATTDDGTVPVRASIEFYNALVAAGVPVEMHLFAHGTHGSGMGRGDAALDLWPMLLEQWLRDLGLLTAPKLRSL